MPVRLKRYFCFFRPVWILVTLLSAQPVLAIVVCTVDWASPTGQTATPLHYGLNAFHGFNPNVAGNPGNATYLANVQYMQPGIIRYCHADQLLDSSNPRGWVISPGTAGYAWDREKITRAMARSYNHEPIIMMNILRWPAYLNTSSTDNRLHPEKYAEFANFCADLVRILNVELNLQITHWEITNELEAKGYWNQMDEVARIHNAAAIEMKKVDPTIKVGGPAFGSPENNHHLTDFIRTAREIEAPLDFITYHQYPNFTDKNFLASDATIWNQATQLGNISNGVRQVLSTWYPEPHTIELFLNEYNINWTWKSGQTPPSELRMRNIKGAVWDALAMISIVNSGITGALAWNEADLAFGKLHTDWSMRPAAHVYHLFNQTQTGAVVTTNSSEPAKVVIFAQRNGRSLQLCLVNRSNNAQSVQLVLSGWSVPPPPDTSFRLRKVTDTGVSEEFITYADLIASGHISLPADTVAFLTTTEPVPQPPLLQLLPSENSIHLRFSSTPGTSHRIEYSSTLQEGSWAVLQSNIPGTGEMIEITHSPTTSAFYLLTTESD